MLKELSFWTCKADSKLPTALGCPLRSWPTSSPQSNDPVVLSALICSLYRSKSDLSRMKSHCGFVSSDSPTHSPSHHLADPSASFRVPRRDHLAWRVWCHPLRPWHPNSSCHTICRAVLFLFCFSSTRAAASWGQRLCPTWDPRWWGQRQE